MDKPEIRLWTYLDCLAHCDGNTYVPISCCNLLEPLYREWAHALCAGTAASVKQRFRDDGATRSCTSMQGMWHTQSLFSAGTRSGAEDLLQRNSVREYLFNVGAWRTLAHHQYVAGIPQAQQP